MRQIKISALGDSLTKGVVLNEENRYSILKQGFINIIGEKLDLCIKNYAKFGCTIGFGHNVIDRHHDEISSSDYTFLEFGSIFGILWLVETSPQSVFKLTWHPPCLQPASKFLLFKGTSVCNRKGLQTPFTNSFN